MLKLPYTKLSLAPLPAGYSPQCPGMWSLCSCSALPSQRTASWSCSRGPCRSLPLSGTWRPSCSRLSSCKTDRNSKNQNKASYWNPAKCSTRNTTVNPPKSFLSISRAESSVLSGINHFLLWHFYAKTRQLEVLGMPSHFSLDINNTWPLYTPL